MSGAPNDLSTNPRRWSWAKLRLEYAGGRGFLAVIVEYERRAAIAKTEGRTNG